MTYLIPAYSFAVLALGGYVAWSLRRLRQLTREADRKR
jgi:heme exporter protein CcmD